MPGRRPHSLRAAINAMCRDCIYDPKSGLGTWREQVAACNSARCPLWHVRPTPRYRDTQASDMGQRNHRNDGSKGQSDQILRAFSAARNVASQQQAAT